jgi:hypothetical protein
MKSTFTDSDVRHSDKIVTPHSKTLLDFLGQLFLIDPETGENLTMSQDPENMGDGSYCLHVHNADYTRNWTHTVITTKR